MARTKKSDWTDYLLYGGIILLLFIFLYQLLILINQALAAGQSLPQAIANSIGQAAANTIAAVEGSFTNAVLSPLSFLSTLFSSVPTFLAALFTSGFNISTLFASAGTSSLLGTLFTADPINTGTGSSTPGTSTGAVGVTTVPSGGTSSAALQQADDEYMNSPAYLAQLDANAGASSGGSFSASQ